jgi:exopolysaccharide biosynthesis protein
MNTLEKKKLIICFLGMAPLFLATRGVAQDVRYGERKVRVGSRTLACKVVTLDLKSGKLAPRLVIASGGVGRTEAFTAMVKRTRAVAAINGSFFDAYNAVGDKDPGMTLIRNGQVLHKGSIGTVLGFGQNGPLMGRLNLPIRGTVEANGRTQEWYAYWLNRTPTADNNVALFTPARGKYARVFDGVSVVINNNEVTQITQGEVAIPPTGYVIHFRGAEERQAAKFPVGAKVGYSITFETNTDREAWQAVSEALGAGPRLLTDGRVTYNPVGEGFSSAKILTLAARRSAVGFTRDGKILLVTVNGVTVRQLASILKQLGAYQAMNLDGGSSSGLYVRGKTLTAPGRPLSNILAFVRL